MKTRTGPGPIEKLGTIRAGLSQELADYGSQMMTTNNVKQNLTKISKEMFINTNGSVSTDF